jgi:uncharacterized membrane protein YgdD (TMEM256/DUF423 family)
VSEQPFEGPMSGMTWIRVAGISGALGVGMGAFGAHSLKETLEKSNFMPTFQTAVHYHMYHALALLAVGLGAAIWPARSWNVAGWSFLLGTLLFSGSLYALTITGYRKLGAITPFGGILYIAGWVALAIAASAVVSKSQGSSG